MHVPMFLCTNPCKFCTDLHTYSGKVFDTRMTPPTRHPDPRVPQPLKPKQITGEKTLLYKKCIKFFSGSTAPRLASKKYFSIQAFNGCKNEFFTSEFQITIDFIMHKVSHIFLHRLIRVGAFRRPYLTLD